MNAAAQTIKPRQRLIFWDRKSSAGSEDVFQLEVSALEFPRTTVFLEHIYDRAARRPTTSVVAASATQLWLSDDLGLTWRTIQLPERLPFLRCFTTTSGRHILQTETDGGVHIFDEAWHYQGRRTAGQYPWHGTWSIDQSPSGVLMFAEYWNVGASWRVLRSDDDGESWSVALEVGGDAEDHRKGFIRHFHTCQADPFEPGVWWLSSGDTTAQNRLWCSRDDGRRWFEISLVESHLVGQVPERRRHNVKRHTAEVFTESAIYWATDDNLGDRARLVRLSRSGESRTLELLCSFSNNEVRNLVLSEAKLFVAISEAKLDRANAQVFCVDPELGVRARFDLGNTGSELSGLCRSRSSKAAYEGVFFSFSDGRILEQGSNFLKWELRRSKRSEGEPARLALQQRLQQTLASHGPADREAVKLNRAYAEHFKCNLCDDSLAEVFSRSEPNYAGLVDPTGFKDAARTEYPCPHCKSRVRTRLGELLLNHRLRNRSGKLLAVSEQKQQLRRFRRQFDTIVHVALQGDFGDPEILVGTDIAGMPHVPSQAFNLYWASCVVDYIPNIVGVANEAYRVLAPGGEFAFFIMPYRVLDDDTTCVVKHYNALSHESYARREPGEETGVPDCRFGVRYLIEVFADAGLTLRRVFLFDQISRTSQAWFVATKPGEPAAAQAK